MTDESDIIQTSGGGMESSVRVLILHSSNFGHGIVVAQALGRQLEKDGLQPRILALDDCAGADMQACEGVIIVASILYGRFSAKLQPFVARHIERLRRVPGAFVSISLTARKAHKRTPQKHLYTRKFLAAAARSGWYPSFCEVLAGVLRYPQYGWLNKRIIQFIMRLTGGETDLAREYEYTDWARVDAFGREFAAFALKANAPNLRC